MTRLGFKIAGLIVLLMSFATTLMLPLGYLTRSYLLAFAARDNDSLFDMILLDPSRRTAYNLTRSTDENEVMPIWSYDNRLAYIADHNTAQVVITDIEQLSTVRVTDMRLRIYQNPLGWSPDGLLSYATMDSEGTPHLMLLDEAGNSAGEINGLENLDDIFVEWLSEREIVFLTSANVPNTQVAYLHLDTGSREILSEGSLVYLYPLVSSDEKLVVFHGFDPANFEWSTFLWREASGAVQITSHELYYGSVAQDIWHEQILFVKTVSGATDLYDYDIETAAWTNLTHDSASESSAVWSPDGQIAYIAYRGDSSYGIYLLDPTTGARAEVFVAYEIGSPVWSQ